MRNRDLKNGDRFGRLVIIGAYHVRPHKHWLHLVRCDCGVEKTICGYDMVRGNSSSCGCLLREQKTNHGMYHTPEYKVWAAMIQRCSNIKSAGYKNYGGRGISVCEEWLSFNNFIADMGARTTPKHTLERVDNNAGYNKDNCIWATRTMQSINTRTYKTNKSGHKGVFLDKESGKYRVSIGVNGRRIVLGSFSELADAVKARKQGEQKYFNI